MDPVLFRTCEQVKAYLDPKIAAASAGAPVDLEQALRDVVIIVTTGSRASVQAQETMAKHIDAQKALRGVPKIIPKRRKTDRIPDGPPEAA